MKAKRNEFWVAKMHERWGGNTYCLFNSLPEKLYGYNRAYTDWYASHGNCFLGDGTKDRFRDVTFESEPVKVRLVRSERETPDFFIQKCGENLFIGNRLERYWHAVPREKGLVRFISKWKWEEAERVPHVYRISPRAFKWVREEDGIIGMDIERAEE